MAAITQRSYGLSGPRYGSFAGKSGVTDDGTGVILVSPPLVEGAGAFTVPSYTGSGAILLSPPLTDATGGFAGVGEESGAGDLLAPGAMLEGTGEFLESPLYTGSGAIVLAYEVEGTGAFTTADEVGSGTILVSPPLVEGQGEFVAPEPIGSGEILVPGPEVFAEGVYEDPPLGIADLQLSGLQLEATGIYLAFGPCVSAANIDLGRLVSCNTQGQAISANKDC